MRERIETKTSEEVIKEVIELLQNVFSNETEYTEFLNYIEQNNEPNRAINLKLQFHNLLNLKLPK